MTLDPVPQKPKLFFIVGCPRSGTTLLVRCLNRHPELHVANESKFIPGLFHDFLRNWPKAPESTLVAWSKISKSRFLHMAASQLDALDRSWPADRAYAQLVRDVLLHALPDGKQPQLLGDKTPDYMFHLELLRRLFPDSKIVHIVRDGRDVALSLAPLNWGPNNVLGAALLWRRYMRRWNQSVSALGNVHELTYESLIDQPQSTLSELFEFLELSSDSFDWDALRVKSGNHTKWKNSFNMTRREVLLFEQVCRAELRQWGYEVSNDPGPGWLTRGAFLIDDVWRRFFNATQRRNNRQNE